MAGGDWTHVAGTFDLLEHKDSEGSRHRCTFAQVEHTAERRRLVADRRTVEQLDRQQVRSR